MISPTKCPICNKNTVYVGRCSNCWWVEPEVLESMAESYRDFAKAWDPEKQQFKLGVLTSIKQTERKP